MALSNIREIRSTDVNALRIDHQIIDTAVDWEQWYLIKSDAHFDSVESDHKLEDKHLRQAVDRDAGIIDLGDLFDAMQGKDDRRGNKAKVARKVQTRAYWDDLTDWACERYGKYADRYIMQARGNHETGILEKNEIDLTQRFAAIMNTSYGGQVNAMGYSGYVRFGFTRGRERQCYTMMYTHGWGAGGKVNKGLPAMMQANHIAEGFDFFFSGHTHNSFCCDYVKSYLNPKGLVKERRVNLLMIPTYKDGWQKGNLGWEAQRGIGAKPKGAWWLRFYYEKKQIKYQIIRAD